MVQMFNHLHAEYAHEVYRRATRLNAILNARPAPHRVAARRAWVREHAALVADVPALTAALTAAASWRGEPLALEGEKHWAGIATATATAAAKALATLATRLEPVAVAD